MNVYRGRGEKRKTTLPTVEDSSLKQTKQTLKRDDPNGVVLAHVSYCDTYAEELTGLIPKPTG